MTKKRLLFIPVTDRNTYLLSQYAFSLRNYYECLFLSYEIYGPHLKITEACKKLNLKTVTDDILNQKLDIKSWFGLNLKLKKIHKQLRQFIKGLKIDMLITGHSAFAMGLWGIYIAKELGIPTLVCQEGARWTFNQKEFSITAAVKYHLANIIFAFYFPPGCHNEDLKIGDNFAVWGEYTKKMAIQHGADKDRIFVVGHPYARRTDRQIVKIEKVMYLDVATSLWRKGTIDITGVNKFRNEVVALTLQHQIELIYKPHPLTPSHEIEAIKEIIKSGKNIRLINGNAAEELLGETDCCITWPSTSIFSILASCVPLVFVDLKIKGFGKIYWNPVVKYNAGISIDQYGSLKEIFPILNNGDWIKNYKECSRLAAEETIGPLDGRASQRFKDVVKIVLKKHKSVH
jgi:hypothetical protein